MFDRDHFRELCCRLAQESDPETRRLIVRELIAILETEQKDVNERTRNAIGH